MENKTWIFGDCHGAFKALKQVFERAPIQKGDTIISLGDICDGWNEVYECVDFLINLEKDHPCHFIKGNHDDWFLDFILKGEHGARWLQGGEATLESYCKNTDSLWQREVFGYRTSLNNHVIPVSHLEFFKNQLHYYVDKDNNCFVHGGFNRHHSMEQNDKEEAYQFWWDRDLWAAALCWSELSKPFKIKDDSKEVFIGHTTTENWKTTKPMHAANIWNLDTGAGWSGKLTIMDLETHDYFQSDYVKDLYPDQKGRN